jgi:hypothetical protein
MDRTDEEDEHFRILSFSSVIRGEYRHWIIKDQHFNPSEVSLVITFSYFIRRY